MSNGRYSPEQWFTIMRNAHKALAKNRNDRRARQALTAAISNIQAANAQTGQQEATAVQDPGALSTGASGAADMMSFGLGPQIARAIKNVPIIGTPDVAEQQAAGEAAHPTAHLVGEGIGLLTPVGVEAAATRAGLMTTGLLGRTAARIASPIGRAAAKTALRMFEGAGYAAAQAAGRKEGSLGERARAAAEAAPYGAAAGLAIPVAAQAMRQTILRPVARIIRGLAGPLEKAAPETTAPVAAAVDPNAALRQTLINAGVLPENVDAQIARNLAASQGAPVRLAGPAPVSTDVPTTAAPRGLLTPIAGTPGFELTGPAPPLSTATPPPTLADMTGMSALQYPRGGLLGDIPLQSSVPNAEGLVGNELNAAAETAARTQRGLTKAQLAYREGQFSGKAMPGSYQSLLAEMTDAATTPLRRKQIIQEFHRRGIVNEYTRR